MYAIILSALLACFSTAVMSYISMATPIGPWIAPTLVLCGMLFFWLLNANKSYQQELVYVTIASSIGGILATAFGFAFPTLYFLDKTLFDEWMAHPFYFISFVSALAGITAWYGIWIANVSETYFLHQERLQFPIAQMVYKMITTYDQIGKACELAFGFISTLVFCMLQDGIRCFIGIFPKAFLMCRKLSIFCFHIPAIEFELWPMLWAIGFVTGHMIVLPLVLGVLSKIFLLQPIHHFFFGSISQTEFLLAFCSGMVISGALYAFSPHAISTLFKSSKEAINVKNMKTLFARDISIWVEGGLLLIICSAFLFYIECSPQLQCYLLVSTLICSYQIIVIAGKIGLAQLGRFATFVLVPGLFLFNLNVVQIAVISTFVEAVAGVAVDILCGRKVVLLAKGSLPKARFYQYFGIVISSLILGVIFWLLINRFKLGSPELFAQRSQARQLLIDAKEFDYWVLLIGIGFGMVLKKLKINPMLVLGALLMPFNISLGLVTGAIGALLVKDREEWYPFWSGVFAADSVWMLFKALG